MNKLTITYLALMIFFKSYAQLPTFNAAFQGRPQVNGSQSIMTAIKTTSNGDSYCVGYFNGTVDFDPSSNIQALVSNGEYDIFIAKYSKNATLLWVKQIGSTLTDQARDLDIDANLQKIYITGSFKGTVDFDPSSSNVFTLTSQNTNPNSYDGDTFLAKYDFDGNFQWAFSVGNTGSGYTGGLKVKVAKSLSSSTIYLLAGTNGILDIDPSAATYNINAGNYNSTFLAQYSDNMQLIWGFILGAGRASIHTFCLNNETNNQEGFTITGSISSSSSNPPIDFNPGVGVHSVAYLGSLSNPFIVRYNSDLTVNKIIVSAMSGYYIGKGIKKQGNQYIMSCSLQGTLDMDFSPNQTVNINGGFALFSYDENLNFIWAKKIVSSFSNDLNEGNISVDAYGGTISVVGGFRGTNDFDPSANTAIGISTNSITYSIFNAIYDLNGNYRSHFVIANETQGSNAAFGRGSCIETFFDNTTNETYQLMGGDFLSINNLNIDFDPSPSSTYYLGNTPYGQMAQSLYLAKYKNVKSIYVSKQVSQIRAGQSMDLQFNMNFKPTVANGCTYKDEYRFDFELSDANGSFQSPVLLSTQYIDTQSSTSVTIPNTTLVGSGYKIRMISREIRRTTNNCSATPSISILPLATFIEGSTTSFVVLEGCPSSTVVNQSTINNYLASEYISTNGNINYSPASTPIRQEVLYSAGKAIIIDANNGSIFTATSIPTAGNTGTIVFEAKIGGCSN